jgi:hypothetical protein
MHATLPSTFVNMPQLRRIGDVVLGRLVVALWPHGVEGVVYELLSAVGSVRLCMPGDSDDSDAFDAGASRGMRCVCF